MLILKGKKGKRFIAGAGANQVIISIHNTEVRADGTVDVQLGFVAEDHVPIDREKVRDQKLSTISSLMDK